LPGIFLGFLNMGCKELWIGCHVSCKKKALIMKKDQDSQQIFVIFWLGKGYDYFG
jgi:hypothetical protein